jgi:hypothetical protein
MPGTEKPAETSTGACDAASGEAVACLHGAGRAACPRVLRKARSALANETMMPTINLH